MGNRMIFKNSARKIVVLYKPSSIIPQSVKVIGRCGDVHNNDVGVLNLHSLWPFHRRNGGRITVTQLQKPLQPSTTVLRTLTFVTMWQQSNNSTLTMPLGFSRRYELIENRLQTKGIDIIRGVLSKFYM